MSLMSMLSARQPAQSAIMVALLQELATHSPTPVRMASVMLAKASSTASRKSASRQGLPLLTEVSVPVLPVLLPVLLPVPVLEPLLLLLWVEASWKTRALSRQMARTLLHLFIFFFELEKLSLVLRTGVIWGLQS